MERRDPTQKALVLAGGGARGSYQVGVWRALMELDWHPQIITGTSVGSLNGAMFALDLYETARDMWTSIRSQDVMELPEEDAVVTEESSLRGAAALPSAYSLVDEGCVTSVKDQKNTSLCWAYAALGACESNILKQGLEIPDAWKNADGTPGDEFDIVSSSLTGKLAGLVAVRDGNNNNGFVGKSVASGFNADGPYVTMKTDKTFTLNTLNVADEGKITIGGKDYYYDNFTAEYDNTTGEITGYTFQNLQVLAADGTTRVAANPADINTGVTARVGKNVDFQGVPYCMSKLNEFVRTFSRYINDLCSSGVDADGKQGLDMLNALNVDGKSMDLSGTTGNTSFQSKKASYYRLTALNWSIHDDVMKDPNKVVVSDKRAIEQGNVEDCAILHKIQDSLTNTDIFKQGSPSQYLESLISNIGVQTKKCKISSQHQDNIVYSINQQRLSESSVDSNEEASNLIIQQNGYNLSCKVMSVLDEIYDKLINGTGV